MTELTATLSEQFSAWSSAEVAAVIFAVLYLLLAIREHIACWICAGISTAIYVGLFYEARLYMESALNLFYFAMAVYGWTVWRRGRSGDTEKAICRWPLAIHVKAIVVLGIATIIAGTLLDRFTDAAFPYIDSATTFAAIWATFLVARKVLENWWYWLAIDIVSIGIYWNRDLELTALLFVFYVLLIPFGLVRWTRSWRRAEVAEPA